MDVNLTAELAQLVHDRVKSGKHNSASQVVYEALRLLTEPEEWTEIRKQELRQKIAAGIGSFQRGEGVDGEEFFAQLEREEEGLERKRQPA